MQISKAIVLNIENNVIKSFLKEQNSSDEKLVSAQNIHFGDELRFLIRKLKKGKKI